MNAYNEREKRKSEKRVAKLRKMHESGLTFAAIARRLGLSRERIRQLLS